jgi:hypothetical protein
MNRENTRLFLETDGVSTMQTDLEALFYAERAGQVYFVDANKSDNSGDGSTWATAYKYLATALAASHAKMALTADRNWAGRNTIYVKGDSLDEDLTKLAQKTDVIGVGSCNQHPRPRLEGTHVIEAQATTDYMGCRFFNIEFYASTAGKIITIPANQNGIIFQNCVFNGNSIATHGIQLTSSHDTEINNCRFVNGFTTACIYVPAGAITNFFVRDCIIQGAGIGIDFDCTTTQAVDCWFIDNLIHTVGVPIDSESDTAFLSVAVVGNRMITDVDTTTVTAGYDFVLGMALGNTVTGKDETDAVPYVLQA